MAINHDYTILAYATNDNILKLIIFNKNTQKSNKKLQVKYTDLIYSM